MKNKLLFALLLSFTISAYSKQETEMRGTVTDIVDGDTIYVQSASNTYKIRLKDVDCPEKKQPYGLDAKNFVEQISFKREVVVQYSEFDRYGRIIGTIIIASNGANINQELLKNGWAYWYKKYSTNASMGVLEEIARTNRLGLWSGTNNIPPWEWRKSQHRRY